MGKRYSKNYSNYILKKKYQYSTKGTIWERDWVTIGAQHQIEKGKRPFFGDSGFLFTDNSIVSGQKHHEFGKIVGEWFYDDVKDASPLVNVVNVNYESDDLRDFAYYGSCVELVRSSIFNIINWFPGCAWNSWREVKWKDGRKSGYLVNNPFNIDFSSDNLKVEEIENQLRFLSLSFKDYEILCKHPGATDSESHQVLAYTVNWRDQSTINACDKIYEVAEVGITAGIKQSGGVSLFDFTFYILMANGELIVVAKKSSDHEFMELRPIKEVRDKYISNFEGFEKILLRTDTNPLYKNRFLKMFETENGTRYAYRDFTWPRINDYCIDIESPSYIAFVDGLIEMSTEYDEMWCDNIWRNMTHESLRNYDWTYTKDFNPGDELDNVAGGNRLEKLVRIYGRVFDDLKRYIDGIKFTAKASYDGINNMPDAELSDRLEYNGWEIYSTIPTSLMLTGQDDGVDLSVVNLDKSYIYPNKWFYAVNETEVTSGTNDIDFLRSLSLSSKYMMQSKGTTKSIDMVMALFGIGSDRDETITKMVNRISEINDEIAEVESRIEAEEDESIKDILGRKKNWLLREKTSCEQKIAAVVDSLTYNITERYFTLMPRRFSENVQKNIADLVHYDNQSWFYDDPYDGVPFGNIELFGEKFIVPYYDSEKYYKGDFTFQSNGGWYKKSLDTGNVTDYTETLSYLNVVSTFSSLLTVNTYSLDKTDGGSVPPSNIYYVVDLSDYINYTENIPINITHYFYINDIYNPQSPDSWNPVLCDYIDEDDWITISQYENLSDEEKYDYAPIMVETDGEEEIDHYAKLYHGSGELYERAAYMDSIISSNIGNNPHVGYGRYDLGQEFKSYMENPFKYYEDNYKLPEEITIPKYACVVSLPSDLYEYQELDGDAYDNFEKPYTKDGRIYKNTQSSDYITYEDYILLDDAGKSLYVVDENKVKAVFNDENRSDDMDSQHQYNIKGLYERLNTVIGDFIYDIDEYETTNKVKNISSTYHYAYGYTKRIDEEVYNSLSPAEKELWSQEIITLDTDGNPVYEYVRNISEDDYNQLSPAEQKGFVKTIVKLTNRRHYRDYEDVNDVIIGIDRAMPQVSYYLNSKLIKIEFTNSTVEFKRYFMNVIGKYVMQMIPSTAITVILFDCDNDVTTDDNG